VLTKLHAELIQLFSLSKANTALALGTPLTFTADLFHCTFLRLIRKCERVNKQLQYQYFHYYFLSLTTCSKIYEYAVQRKRSTKKIHI
jgi:hypothetical protein